MRIAVDAMGGDDGYLPIVEGVKLFLQESDDSEIILVGEKDILNKVIDVTKYKNLSIVEGKDSVDMKTSPSEALRSKKDSSISVGIMLHKEGKADAFFSAGNTGVVMAFSIMILKRLSNVKRPAIAATFPTVKNQSLLVDAGANVDCKAINLLQFGAMGSAYYSKLMDVEKPSIGLLSVGEENSKGNEQVVLANKLFRKSNLNFYGNIEGYDIFSGLVDVIVVDGFTGNIILKYSESLFKQLIKMAGGEKFFPKVLMKKFDSDEQGAVPLIGLNGNILIGHGNTSPKAVKNAFYTIRNSFLKKVNLDIEVKLGEIIK